MRVFKMNIPVYHDFLTKDWRNFNKGERNGQTRRCRRHIVNNLFFNLNVFFLNPRWNTKSDANARSEKPDLQTKPLII